MSRQNRDIEWLLSWAFGDQRVETAARSTVPAPSIAPSALLQFMALGCRVDTSGAGARYASVGLGVADCADDALALYGLVRRLPLEAGAIVAQFARTGTRPDWCPEGAGQMVPLLDGRGRERVIWRDPVNRKGRLGIEQQFVGTRPETVAFQRNIWTVWHQAMAALVEPANAEMVDHCATGPMVDAAPWAASAMGRVLHAAGDV